MEKFNFGVNGTWGNSGNPESGASGTGARSFTPSGETWTFGCSVYDSHWEANFGSSNCMQSHQATQMLMAMETLNMQYHQVTIMHLTQKI